MELDVNSLRRVGGYFNSRARESANSLYANGYSSQLDEMTVDELYDMVFEEIETIISFAPDEKVLDIGCGTGEILFRVSRETGQAVGLDLSEEMVNLTRRKGLNANVYDGGRIPFDDMLFDHVIIYQVLTNLPQNIAVHLIREAFRVVKQGGGVLIGAVPHPIRSNIPTHSGNWLRSLKGALGLTDVIQYFSYDYSFFTNEFDILGLSRLSIVPCRLERTGWKGKFHVLLIR